MFANIRDEHGNIIIYDLNTKVCEFLILAKWPIPFLSAMHKAPKTHKHLLAVRRWERIAGQRGDDIGKPAIICEFHWNPTAVFGIHRHS